jgi:hypothetical protein
VLFGREGLLFLSYLEIEPKDYVGQKRILLLYEWGEVRRASQSIGYLAGIGSK